MYRYLAALAFVACLTIAGPIRAEIPHGSPTGLGYDVDLNGLTLRIGPLDGMRFDFNFGFGLNVQTGAGGTTTSEISPGFRLLLPVGRYENLLMQGALGAFLQLLPSSNTTQLNITLFGGLLPELFVLEHLSIELAFGAAISFDRIGDQLLINFGTVGKGLSIVSGAAFHWYF